MGGLGGEAPQKKNSNPQIICYDPRFHDPTFEGGYPKTFFQNFTFEGEGILKWGYS